MLALTTRLATVHRATTAAERDAIYRAPVLEDPETEWPFVLAYYRAMVRT